MREFEYVGHSVEFPPVTLHEVAAAIGTSKGHNGPSYESAVRISPRRCQDVFFFF